MPLTALNDGLRAMLLDGEGLLELLPEAAVLGVWTALSFSVALKIFRWD